MLERDLVKVLSKWLQKERKEIKFSASDVNKLPLDREIKNPLAVVAVATDMLTITDSHSHCVYQVSITNNGACLRGTCTVLMKLCNSQFQTPPCRAQTLGHLTFLKKFGQIPRYVACQMPHLLELPKRVKSPTLQVC